MFRDALEINIPAPNWQLTQPPNYPATQPRPWSGMLFSRLSLISGVAESRDEWVKPQASVSPQNPRSLGDFQRSVPPKLRGQGGKSYRYSATPYQPGAFSGDGLFLGLSFRGNCCDPHVFVLDAQCASGKCGMSDQASVENGRKLALALARAKHLTASSDRINHMDERSAHILHGRHLRIGNLMANAGLLDPHH